jgi:methionyl-tRNA formyltransferase
LERLFDLVPQASITVCCFKEEPWEPAFQRAIAELTERRGGRFIGTRDAAGAFSSGEAYDVMFAISWRYLVPMDLVSMVRYGAFAIHDSLLPAYRGFAPTVWAMVNGEDHSGATLFRMTHAMDDGPVVDALRVPIVSGGYIAEVMEDITMAYLHLLERNLPALLTGTAGQREQNAAEATYTCKRIPHDDRIDWRWPARRIVALVHAVSRPYSGAYCLLQDRRITIWRASIPMSAPLVVGGIPGRLVPVMVSGGVYIMAGDGPVLVEEVQYDGDVPRPAQEILSSPSITFA